MRRTLTGILGMSFFVVSVFISGCIASTSDSTESEPDVEADIENSEAALAPGRDGDAVSNLETLACPPSSYTQYRTYKWGGCGVCQDLSYNDGEWEYYQKRTCNMCGVCTSWSTYAKNCASC